MIPITLRVLDGADRGRIFELPTAPVTIGREEGNTIQLNDERISRYHVKLQEDHEKLVLTDLESTNGTKVNGENIQLRILRFGDMICMGRSVLLYGTREEIAKRMAILRNDDKSSVAMSDVPEAASFDFGLHYGDNSILPGSLQTLLPPELPQHLSPAQAAQLCELIEYVRIRIRHLLDTVRTEHKKTQEQIVLDFDEWQHLLDLQSRLAEYMRGISEPDNGE